MTQIDPAQAPSGRAQGVGVALGTALAYGVVGTLALTISAASGYASPLYPAAGIALAATLVHGRAALVGVFVGAVLSNVWLGVAQGLAGGLISLLSATVGVGAALQAALGAALVRRYVSAPLTLDSPRDIGLTCVFGALLAGTVCASVATPMLSLTGVVPTTASVQTWLTWWLGDTLGVLIGLPLALTVIGRPREDWRPRRLSVGVPLLLALLLLAAGIHELRRVEQQRLEASFDRDSQRLAGAMQQRLAAPLHALQGLNGLVLAHGRMDQRALADASRWWLAQPLNLQAMGYSVRVPQAELAAFEAGVRATDDASFRVFDRDDGQARAADGEALVVRHIEPVAGNAAAVGVNVLSIPAARAAVSSARGSGEPAATAGFRLTQAAGDETGIVLYQALYRGQPTSEAERQASFQGVVFVTLNADRSLSALPEQAYLHWCLLDPDPSAGRRRLAGPPGCEATAPPPGRFHLQHALQIGNRPLTLHVAADPSEVPGKPRETAWLMSVVGLASASLLGALLLTMTGQRRRTELAVQAGTAELRRQMDERTQAETALRASEARLRSILDHVPLGVMFLDPAGRIIECNQRSSEMLGRSPSSLMGVAVADLVHAEDQSRLLQLRREMLAGSEVASIGPFRLLHAAAPEQRMRASASPLRSTHGRVERFVTVLEDVTETLRLEASERALHRAEAANRAKSDFLSRMSHELRTPLNAMIGFTQLLDMEQGPALTERQRGWVQQSLRAGWHLLEMINATLDLARIESGSVQLARQRLPLSPLLAACQAMVAAAAQQRNVSVTVVDPEREVFVTGDPTRIKQVLINLLSNAIKYNRPGGWVVLHADPGSNGMAAIEVSDNGLGMTPEQMADLFKPYNRLGREGSGVEGTGIGLVISRGLCELMDGALEVRSQASRGSTFTVRLPAAAGSDEPDTDAPAPQTPPYQRRRVHYIEDNETNVEVMRGVLAQRPQVSLETSALGLDGLAAIRRHRPDLILLDMHLPDISGLELLRHLKLDNAAADIPVVVVSADATASHIEQALTLGAMHYVTKPLDVGSFLRIIDSILQASDSKV